jgi:hypothetical protein
MFYAKRIRRLEEKIKQLENQSAVHVWSDSNYYVMPSTDILKALLKYLKLEITNEPSKLTFIPATKEEKQ